MAAVVNSSFKLGESWVIDAVAHDSLGNVINLTGCTIRWRMTLFGVVLFDIAVGSGIALVNGGTTGEFLITITPAMQVAAGVTVSFCQHQCRVTLADGVTVTDQFAGSLQVLPSLF